MYSNLRPAPGPLIQAVSRPPATEPTARVCGGRCARVQPAKETHARRANER